MESLTLVCIGIALLTLSFGGLEWSRIRRVPNTCTMTYSWPVYTLLQHATTHSKYQLYAVDMKRPRTRLRATPLLFIPGHLGSAKQARSIGRHLYDLQDSQYDVFAIDFQEEMTALSGHVLQDQSNYVNECVQSILQMYQSEKLEHVHSVTVLAHSMGGIVVRGAFTLPSYAVGSITTIVTLSSPHQRPPLAFNPEIQAFYTRINSFWSDAAAMNEAHVCQVNEQGESTCPRNPAQELLNETILVSLAGGFRDQLVHSALTHVTGFVAPDRGFAILTSSIPSVKLSMDHLCLLWCHELLAAIAKGMDQMLDPLTRQPFVSPSKRLKAFKDTLLPETIDSDSTELLQALQYGYSPHEASIAQVIKHSSIFMGWFYLYGASVVAVMFGLLLTTFAVHLASWQDQYQTGLYDNRAAAFPSLSEAEFLSTHAKGLISLLDVVLPVGNMSFKRKAMISFSSFTLVGFATSYQHSGVFEHYCGPMWGIFIYRYVLAVGILSLSISLLGILAHITSAIRRILSTYTISSMNLGIITFAIIFFVGHMEAFHPFSFRHMDFGRELAILFLSALTYLYGLVLLVGLAVYEKPEQQHYAGIVFGIYVLLLPCFIGAVLENVDVLQYPREFTFGEVMRKVWSIALLLPSILHISFIRRGMIPLPAVAGFSTIAGFHDAIKVLKKPSNLVSPEDCSSCDYEEGGSNAVYVETTTTTRLGTKFRVVACNCMEQYQAEEKACNFCRRICTSCGAGEISKFQANRFLQYFDSVQEQTSQQACFVPMFLSLGAYAIFFTSTLEYRLLYLACAFSTLMSIYHVLYTTDLDIKVLQAPIPPMMYEVPVSKGK